MSTIYIDEAGQAAEFHEVVQSVSITHLLQQRDAVLERLAQAFSILQEATTSRSARTWASPTLSPPRTIAATARTWWENSRPRGRR